VTVTVELFGLARHWSGRRALDVEAATLGEALRQAGLSCPRLVPACIDDGRLQPGFLANVNSGRFTRDPETPLEPGDVVLILSADVGG
jgi:molybdopterin converting factor small subunit